MEVQVIAICPERQLFWPADAEQAACADSAHDHVQREVHRHLDRVTLPDGTSITAASYDPAAPYERDAQPAYGLYLDHRWQPPWPHDHLEWPDFGVPEDPTVLAEQLRSLLTTARTGESVEVGCLGGHGRTGTALACLAILTGVPPSQAVSWVRENYCVQAVETDDQQEFVSSFRPDR